MTRSSAWPYNTRAWREVRALVLARDGHMCQIRGPRCEVEADQVDHIVPWLAGGAVFDPENLRAACGDCNRRRARRDGVGAPTPVRPSREWL